MVSARRGVAVAWGLALGAVVLAAPVPARPIKPDERLVAEVSVPPPGFAEPGKPSALRIVLGQTNLRVYDDIGTPQEKFRRAIRETQILLWATSQAVPPVPLRSSVKALRGKGTLPAALKTVWPIPTTPAAERAIRNGALANSRSLAKYIYALESQIERLDEVATLRESECKRWQANYDLMRAWLVLRIIHFEEVAYALGQLRREFPNHDPSADKTWKLVAREKVGDVAARKLVRPVEQRLDRIMKDYPDTVWADLAARNRVRSLGVEWVTLR